MTMCDEGEQGANAIHSTLLYALLTVTRYSSPKYLGTLSYCRLSYTPPLCLTATVRPAPALHKPPFVVLLDWTPPWTFLEELHT